MKTKFIIEIFVARKLFWTNDGKRRKGEVITLRIVDNIDEETCFKVKTDSQFRKMFVCCEGLKGKAKNLSFPRCGRWKTRIVSTPSFGNTKYLKLTNFKACHVGAHSDR